MTRANVFRKRFGTSSLARMRTTPFNRRVAARLPAGLSLTRQGLVSEVRRIPAARAVSPFRRVPALVCGSVLIGLGVGVFVHAELGNAPSDVFLSGLSRHLGVTLGQASWVFGGVLFAVATLLGRRPCSHAVGLVLLNGTTVDLAVRLIRSPDQMWVRMAFVVLGTLLIASGASIVVHEAATGGPFEYLMQAGTDRGIDAQRVRTGLEVGVIAIGVLIGGSFGPATAAFAVIIGPMIQLGMRALGDHRRGRELRKAEEHEHALALAGLEA